MLLNLYECKFGWTNSCWNWLSFDSSSFIARIIRPKRSLWHYYGIDYIMWRNNTIIIMCISIYRPTSSKIAIWLTDNGHVDDDEPIVVLAVLTEDLILTVTNLHWLTEYLERVTLLSWPTILEATWSRDWVSTNWFHSLLLDLRLHIRHFLCSCSSSDVRAVTLSFPFRDRPLILMNYRQQQL